MIHIRNNCTWHINFTCHWSARLSISQMYVSFQWWLINGYIAWKWSVLYNNMIFRFITSFNLRLQSKIWYLFTFRGNYTIYGLKFYPVAVIISYTFLRKQLVFKIAITSTPHELDQKGTSSRSGSSDMCVKYLHPDPWWVITSLFFVFVLLET